MFLYNSKAKIMKILFILISYNYFRISAAYVLVCGKDILDKNIFTIVVNNVFGLKKTLQ